MLDTLKASCETFTQKGTFTTTRYIQTEDEASVNKPYALIGYCINKNKQHADCMCEHYITPITSGPVFFAPSLLDFFRSFTINSCCVARAKPF